MASLMNEDNYSVFNAIEPPLLYLEDPKFLEFITNSDFDFSYNPEVSYSDDFGINNPFENLGYKIPDFNIPLIEQPEIKKSVKLSKYKNHKEYIETMYPILYLALENNGISGDQYASTLVAMTAHESGWGNDFSRRTNNYAGIKGKGSGQVTTKEWSPSKGYYSIKSSFKSYSSIEEFADDYVKKLKNTFKAFNGTPSDFVSNIKKKGYFTAPLSTYLNSVNRIKKEVESYGT